MSTPFARPRNRIVLFHTMDPRGAKLGGIETHVRLMLAHHPATTALLFVGLDEVGDLELGRVVELDHGGRRIDFLPVVRVPAQDINGAAKSIRHSTTLRFTMGLFRHLRAIRAAARGLPGSCEIERFEFAPAAWLLGRPLVLLVHNEGTRKDAMDSLLKKYWFLHLFSERLAFALARRIFAVNPAIAERIAGLSPRFGAKTEIMSVSVDTRCFSPTPFKVSDDAFHLCFAGRLDAFKDPDLMMATLARLAGRLDHEGAGRFRRLVFDYVGASDPGLFSTFVAVAGLTVRHGIKKPGEVAAVMRRAHAGLITSFFEGMPCYLLEMLATGRPVVAIALPQFEPVIVNGLSGYCVPRADSPDASAIRLAEKLFEIARAVDAERLDPSAIAAQISSFSVDAQLRRLTTCHEALAAGSPRHPMSRRSVSSA